MCPPVIVQAGSGQAKAAFCHGRFRYFFFPSAWSCCSRCPPRFFLRGGTAASRGLWETERSSGPSRPLQQATTSFANFIPIPQPLGDRSGTLGRLSIPGTGDSARFVGFGTGTGEMRSLRTSGRGVDDDGSALGAW